MEYIETTIGKIAKYNEYLDEWAREVLEDNLDNEELLKMFRRYKRTLELIARHFYPNTPHKDYLEGLLNEIYTSLRKVNYTLTDYEKASVFSMKFTKNSFDKNNKVWIKMCSKQPFRRQDFSQKNFMEKI